MVETRVSGRVVLQRLAALASLVALSLAIALPARAQDVTEFAVPTANSIPYGITSGPDGALWFTESAGSKLGRLTTAGAFTEFPLPTPNSQPTGITAGPDGALWFTESAGNKVGRFATSGTFAEFPLPTPNSQPTGITAGPDGALWFTELAANKVGRLTPAGALAEFPLPTPNSEPTSIATGPDGALWFTESAANKIGRLTTAGAFTEFPLPTPNSQPSGIIAGPDGALWFTESAANKIGRLTPAGEIAEFALPTTGARAGGIADGADGALWFAEGQGKIGRITTEGTITEFAVPTARSFPLGITTGPDAALWFTESLANKIGRITTTPATPTPIRSPLPTATPTLADSTATPTPGAARVGPIPTDLLPGLSLTANDVPPGLVPNAGRSGPRVDAGQPAYSAVFERDSGASPPDPSTIGITYVASNVVLAANPDEATVLFLTRSAVLAADLTWGMDVVPPLVGEDSRAFGKSTERGEAAVLVFRQANAVVSVDVVGGSDAGVRNQALRLARVLAARLPATGGR